MASYVCCHSNCCNRIEGLLRAQAEMHAKQDDHVSKTLEDRDVITRLQSYTLYGLPNFFTLNNM